MKKYYNARIAISDSKKNYLPLGDGLQELGYDVLFFDDLNTQYQDIINFEPTHFITEACFNNKMEDAHYTEDQYNGYIKKLIELKKKKITRVIWAVDEPAISNRLGKFLGHFDLLLTHSFNHVHNRNIRTFYFPCFYNPKEYFNIDDTPDENSISFIGSLYAKRCGFLNEVLPILTEKYRVNIVGSKGLGFFEPNGIDRCEKIIQNEQLTSATINKVMNNSLITLCFSSYGDLDYRNPNISEWKDDYVNHNQSWGLIQRAFEVLPTNSMLLMDDRAHLVNHLLFEKNKVYRTNWGGLLSDMFVHNFSFVSYDSIDACLKLIDFFIDNTAYRQYIVKLQQEYAKQNTYVARAFQLTKILNI